MTRFHLKNVIIAAVLVLGCILIALLWSISGEGSQAAPSAAQASAETVAAEEAGTASEAEAYSIPDFTVAAENSQKVSYQDLSGAGKPMVICFWASWSSDCQSMLFALQDLYGQYSSQVQFIIINATDGTAETQQTARDYLKQHSLTFPVYFDLEGSAAKACRVAVLPQTFFVSADGEIVLELTGNAGTAALENGISLLADGAAAG